MPYYNGDPRRDHNFDNHPHSSYILGCFKPGGRNMPFSVPMNRRAVPDSKASFRRTPPPCNSGIIGI